MKTLKCVSCGKAAAIQIHGEQTIVEPVYCVPCYEKHIKPNLSKEGGP